MGLFGGLLVGGVHFSIDAKSNHETYGPDATVAGSFANNYPGFISYGKYDFWNTYAQAEQSGDNTCKDPEGDPYEIPTGDRQVSVYTDEHGEIPLGIFCRASLAEYMDAERLFTETKQGFGFYHRNFPIIFVQSRSIRASCQCNAFY